MKRVSDDFWKVERTPVVSIESLLNVIEKTLSECDVFFVTESPLFDRRRHVFHFDIKLFFLGGRFYGRLKISGPDEGFLVSWLPQGVRREEMTERTKCGLRNSFSSGYFGSLQPWAELGDRLTAYIELIYKGTDDNGPCAEKS